MPGHDSILDGAAIAEARALLSAPRPAERLWPVLVAAAALTLASLAFAAAMVVAPPVTTQHTVQGAP